MTTELHRCGPTTWEKVRAGLEALFVSAPAGFAAGMISGVVLFWLIEPECYEGEWFCGLGEAMVAMGLGAVVCVGVFAAIALRMIRGSLPVGHRAATIGAVVFGLPGILVALPVLGGLFGL